MRKLKLLDINYTDEINKYKTRDAIVGRNELMQRIMKDVI